MSIFFVFLFLIGIVSGAFKPQREFKVKQGSLLNNGRSYTITETDKLASAEDRNRFTISNEFFSLGKKLVLLENGKPLYQIKHKIGHLYQKWNIYDAVTGDTIGTLKHRPSLIHDSYKVRSSKFGTFRISGNLGSRTFAIKKDGHKVAEIHKDRFHLHDTYTVKIEAKEDPAIILLITIAIDEIRQH